MRSQWHILRKFSLRPPVVNLFYKIMVPNLEKEQLMYVFHTVGIKHIYSNPYYPQGNAWREHVHNFLKPTIVKFTYGSQPEWDNALPLATYCYNITLSVDDLESPFYLVHG